MTAIWAALLVLGAVITTVPAADAATSHVPFGSFDRLSQIPGGLSVRGWAIDPDTTAAINVDIYVDGHAARRLLANLPRPDVERAHPGYGANHGFAATMSRAAGRHTVCAYAINRGSGSTNPLLGCHLITLNYNPVGRITSVRQNPGGLTVFGWTFDPDAPRTALSVSMNLDGRIMNGRADQYRADVASAYPYAGGAHGFSFTASAAQGTHSVCVTASNVRYGTNARLPCVSPTLNFNPRAVISGITRTFTGARVTGWATDPDTSSPVTVVVSADGGTGHAVVADDPGTLRSGHNYAYSFALGAGQHTICVYARNLAYGTGNSPTVCRTFTLNFDPFGSFERVTRSSVSTNVAVTGWTIDPNTASPITVSVTMDGRAVGTPTANQARLDVRRAYPAYGALHGFHATYAADDGEHQLCIVANNVSSGANKSLGCRIINAVHPVPPSVPRNVTATGLYGAATVTWAEPLSDGGAPWSSFTVTSMPGSASVRVGPTTHHATILGLHAGSWYRFTVVATNIAGRSRAGVSTLVRTQTSPPPQTTPAPVSTSRYIRNIRIASSTELRQMRAEGVADARANPSGHSYVMLLDIGGQDQHGQGVVLSATTRFVSYANLVKCIQYYVMGYASARRASAPAVIAIGTNNDMDVSSTAGAQWARSVVNPIVSFARRYPGLRIMGANDIEPGFSATYAQTRSWLSGYLSSTSAGFLFNGSADGCSWTATRRGCNNGWTMSGLYQLAAGASPRRIVNLPQIYNYTMAAQWKYISLTGVSYSHPRIRFGGPLTEWTACYQARSCYSLTGRSAWTALWRQLQSSVHLRVSSLPYSTDLRIDR